MFLFQAINHMKGNKDVCGAHIPDRTEDLFLTMEVLCQLSYMGSGLWLKIKKTFVIALK